MAGAFGTFLRNFTLRERKVWLSFFGRETWAGRAVTPATAMEVAAFWACVRLLAQTIATLPLGVYQRRPDGGRILASEHALYALLHDTPNADQTACEFWEGVVACICLWGNAFVEKSLSGGRLVALTLLRPDLMQVDRREDGSLRYRYSDPSGAIEYDEGELMHVRGFGVGGDLGLSVLAHARQTISSTIATDEAAARTFANGMRPGGFFTYEKGSLTPEQREQARKALIEPMQGVENAGRIGLLEAGGGFKWQEVVIPPADAELLASRRWHVEEVARWFGIPPILIGHASEGQTMWGSGVEQIMLGWLTLGLRPYLTRIEQAVKRSLIAPADRATLYAEFAVEGLLRADSAGRAEFASKMIQNAGMTPNEWRAKENMPPIEGGDQLFINSTLVPLAMAGQRPGRVQPAPGEPIPEDV